MHRGHGSSMCTSNGAPWDAEAWGSRTLDEFWRWW